MYVAILALISWMVRYPIQNGGDRVTLFMSHSYHVPLLVGSNIRSVKHLRCIVSWFAHHHYKTLTKIEHLLEKEKLSNESKHS